MTARTLAQWLDFQQRQHPRDIALGLERVGAVHARLRLPPPAPVAIVVAGTNGKGSTVAYLEAMLRAAGYRVGTYTSPHVRRYNERVRIDGIEAGDRSLVDAFARIESVRGDTPLTWFEYGTLAAFDVLGRAALDVAVLEVGLGGRLDAVNLVDADVAIVTGIDLDHQEFLGPDRDSIAREKAGVMRAGMPAIVGDPEPPRALLDAALSIGAVAQRIGVDFRMDAADAGGWTWRHRDGTVVPLPPLAMASPAQPRNAACAIAALHALRERLAVPVAAMAAGAASARAPGRLQRVAESPEVVVDVAHNPQAARELATWLAGVPPRRTVALFSALADKDIAAMVAPLAGAIASWHLFGLADATPRGLTAAALRERVIAGATDSVSTAHGAARAALVAARADAGADGRVLAFGSFYAVAAVLEALDG